VVRGDVHVAVMGCEVNGPGEAREADVGIAYGHAGYGLLFKKGKIVKRLKYDELEIALLEEAQGIARGEPRRGEADPSVHSNGTALGSVAGLHPQAEEILANTRF
jgi:4-hydroxy-3-methylbut-2-en-1-yl diphosphate synthase IspG/GcpE